MPTHLDNYLNQLTYSEKFQFLMMVEQYPLELQELALNNPPGSMIEIDDKDCFVVGFAMVNKKPCFILSEIDPQEDYDSAVKEVFYLPASIVTPIPPGE